MAIYSVLEPPARRRERHRMPDRFAFVRDGVYVRALLLPPFWMLWHRLWLVLIGYAILTAGLQLGLHTLGASEDVRFWAQVLLHILVGLEAGTLRRWTLRRRRWRDVGIVSGDSQEEAERRFFEAWRRAETNAPPAPLATPARPEPAARRSEPPATDIVGLFPQPGAPR